MAWYSDIHKSDSEDESVVDDEPTTPTVYSSKQSLLSEGTLYVIECVSMTHDATTLAVHLCADSGKGSSMHDLTTVSPGMHTSCALSQEYYTLYIFSP